jgi:flagellar hook protein FlgE
MLGAIYTGLSGMDAYTKGLDTISNNVANLNTLGFKASSVQFADLFDNGGSGGLTFVGSKVSQGEGVRIGSTFTDFSQGDLTQTKNDLDLAIQGSGFLTLLNKGNTYYTRTGEFTVDNDGYISQQSTGYHLGVLDSTNQVVALNVDESRTSAPAATTKITFADNLSSSGTSATVSNITVYDDRGGAHVWTATFTKSQDAGATDQWDVAITDSTGASIGTASLKFIGSVVDPATAQTTLSYTPVGADEMLVTLDFSTGVTSFSSGTSSTLRAASVDGNAEGNLTGVSVDDTGQVLLTYSNTKTKQMGAVALADFRDPQALKQMSNGMFKNEGTGQMRVLPSGIDGIGTLVSDQLEASNVDLSREFGDLILIQRGFQACSQVISVSNDMIQQLFGIRGQG